LSIKSVDGLGEESVVVVIVVVQSRRERVMGSGRSGRERKGAGSSAGGLQK
jgi:hypothetical protein